MEKKENFVLIKIVNREYESDLGANKRENEFNPWKGDKYTFPRGGD